MSINVYFSFLVFFFKLAQLLSTNDMSRIHVIIFFIFSRYDQEINSDICIAIFKKHSEPNVSMTNKMTLALDSSNLQYYLETTTYNDNVQYYL